MFCRRLRELACPLEVQIDERGHRVRVQRPRDGGFVAGLPGEGQRAACAGARAFDVFDDQEVPARKFRLGARRDRRVGSGGGQCGVEPDGTVLRPPF
jgi:hypothetical protein